MKRELKNILVPVDFHESSMKAVDFAHHLAGQVEGEIFLLHVIETPGLMADLFASGDLLVKITDQSKEKLLGLSERMKKSSPGILVSNRVERGKPHEKILKVAEEIDARFIILAENQHGDRLKKALGSTIYHVTLKSPVPVLTLKGDATEMGKKILVPLDLTRETRKQLCSAVVYGQNYGASIVLVSAMIAGMDMKESLIYQKLTQAKKVLEENGVDCQMKLFEHSTVPPFNRVLDYADEIGADMILVMTHQEGYTHDNYIGAFAHHIINRSRVPVISLTSSATGSGLNKLIKFLVDPVGWFKD
ncbi:MAG TPA: universal stress protein [Bacteroides sp.]|nr:universal stress protein [Bacteroides sp.]